MICSQFYNFQILPFYFIINFQHISYGLTYSHTIPYCLVLFYQSNIQLIDLVLREVETLELEEMSDCKEVSNKKKNVSILSELCIVTPEV